MANAVKFSDHSKKFSCHVRIANCKCVSILNMLKYFDVQQILNISEISVNQFRIGI